MQTLIQLELQKRHLMLEKNYIVSHNDKVDVYFSCGNRLFALSVVTFG